MDIKEQLLKSFEETLEDGSDYLDFEVVVEGDWVQDHKYQYMDTIIKFADKFYEISQSRSGSYHTDWYYNDSEIREVKPVERVITTIVYEPV